MSSSLVVAAAVVSADTTTEPVDLCTGSGAAVGLLEVLAVISGPFWGGGAAAGTVKLLDTSAVSMGPAAAGWVTQATSAGVKQDSGCQLGMHWCEVASP